MDKKAKKKDVAVFANMLKELMNDPMDEVLVTLDRDIQHFVYGRVATLVKHNEGKPIGTVADISAVMGAAFGDVLKEFLREQNDPEKLDQLIQTARANLLQGFEARAPKIVKDAEEAMSTEPKETVENDT
jgi:predicted membrane chloride channel (bestrophin family)